MRLGDPWDERCGDFPLGRGAHAGDEWIDKDLMGAVSAVADRVEGRAQCCEASPEFATARRLAQLIRVRWSIGLLSDLFHFGTHLL